MAIRRMREGDLDCILGWRNHPDVRRFMLSQGEITSDEHRAWFDHASQDETRALLVYHDQGQPLGCVVFSGVKVNSAADWSFYSAPGSPVGTGTKVCESAIYFAFRELGVHKVTGRVLEFNRASIRLHQRLGFKNEGELKEHILINGLHHNLIIFGLLSDDWQFACSRE